jgi:hypothetical protein
MIIQAKAKNVFDNLIATVPDLNIPSSVGSVGWFEHFKGCHGSHNFKITDEAPAADLVGAEKLPVLLQAYLPQHLFNLDKTRLL